MRRRTRQQREREQEEAREGDHPSRDARVGRRPACSIRLCSRPRGEHTVSTGWPAGGVEVPQVWDGQAKPPVDTTSPSPGHHAGGAQNQSC